MTPEEFIAKWSKTTTLERASAQSHFNDLCALLGEKTPHEADPAGEWYAFEKGVEKTGLGRGWADVWKRGCFGWEYKSKSGGRTSTMSAALRQLQLYSLALESPPLLIVSDIDTIEIHTAFQNAVQEIHVIRLAELADPEKRQLVKWAFDDPERLRPKRTRNQITAEAAGEFADLAFQLRGAGHDPQKVAHFLNKLLFCMFAEDAGLLRSGIFTDVTEKGVESPDHFESFIKQLFKAMQTGGAFGAEIISWFNGGLFDGDETISLTLGQIRILRELARMDWSQIEPAIFGTLFERGLDPSKRSQLGAHYTDPNSIMRLVNPTIVEPLLDEWRATKATISQHIERMEKVKTKAATEKRRKAAQDTFFAFLERLRNFRVLDPACGSGNFLYLALQALKGVEHRANIEAEAIGVARQSPAVGPESVLGIEINAYAAELARVTVWIGEIQWMLSHGYSLGKEPILKALDNIEQRDAILQDGGTEPQWPKADVIVGNPPFLGNRKFNADLGQEYSDRIRKVYKRHLPRSADLCCYWFYKAWRQIRDEKCVRAGLVATSTIRHGKNRQILDVIAANGQIFNAWNDQPWVNAGAAVRVSFVCFTKDVRTNVNLNGNKVSDIRPDLSADGTDVLSARKLRENANIAFQGSILVGPFNISGDVARKWLRQPRNPDGSSNSEVIRPLYNATDVVRRPRDEWVIDFGETMSVSQAAMFVSPFEFAKRHVRPFRSTNGRQSRAGGRWWIHHCTRPEFRVQISRLSRYIVTPRVAKHRLFAWLHPSVVPDSRLYSIAREDDQTFGVLHSRIHELWSLATCSWHGVGNDPTYNAASTFETFPFPKGMTPDLSRSAFINAHAAAVGEAARNLVGLRDRWLNPEEWIDRVSEVVPGYPDRLVPKEGHESDLKKRTLTQLYNERPDWLENAHTELDQAVAAAYGWSVELSDDEILAKLLDLNLSRAAA